LWNLNCCSKGSHETGTQNGSEDLANSIWLWSQFGNFTKLGKTKGGIRNPPFEIPRSFSTSAVIAYSSLAMLSDQLNTRRFELGILESLCKAFIVLSGISCRD
jgi:hypothetical protein